jgi:cobalt-zinc-cadmium resistance protein CzcA
VRQVVEDIEARIPTVQKALPEGLVIEPYLVRSDLVKRAIGTVKTNLIEGALIVIFVLVLFLGNWRAGLIVAA